MREKELRLALVCYGGVSLAVYMHGVVKEIWKLLRASRAFHDQDPASLSDSERVYLDLLAEIGQHVELQVIVDIVAGSSAGGINGVLLAHAIATGQSLEPLRELWLEGADIDRLLDPDAAPSSRWSKVYAEPLIWMAGRRYEKLFEKVEPGAREEVRAKLSRLVRSRWFEPPFSGPGFTRQLLAAFEAMAAAPAGPPLVPPGLPLDLFVTVTDFNGHPERLRLHSPPEVTETEHRLVIAFHDDGVACERHLGDPAELVLAARATASVPGVFPPLQLPELDLALAERGHAWPGRDAFLRRLFPSQVAAGIDPASACLVDGGVLDNAPFGPAIAALRNRPANREVDRRFLFIDPMPGLSAVRLRPGGATRPPSFFTTLFRSLSDIPREQPIRDSLESLHHLSRRVKRARYVLTGMRPAVEAAIERAFGSTLLFHRLTPARLDRLRAGAHHIAARESGFAYPAYGQLKLSGVVEAAALLLVALGRHEERGGGVERVRDAIWAHVRQAGITRVEAAAGAGAERAPFVLFLRRFDTGFRVRRLRWLIRALSELAAAQPPEVDREPLEDAKAQIYALLAPFLARAASGFFDEATATAAARADADAAAALAALGDALDLSATDALTDAGLIATLERLPPAIRRALLLAYLGFPFYDVAALPLLQDEALDEGEEIKVDRIAPEDTRFLRPGAGSLKGVQLNSFGAFFARSYRENDYLWGRLHAAERLIDIVASTLPEALPTATIDALKHRAMRAIVASERAHLAHVPDLLASLDRALASAGASIAA